MLKYAPLVLANLRRRRLRTTFTLASIVIAFLMFGLLEAMRNAFAGGADLAGQDRLMTLHKVSIIQPLPESYRNRIRTVDGVKAVSSATWFGGVYQDERNQLAVFPVDDEIYLDIYPELRLPPAEREEWLRDRRGALVGRSLAREFGWKVGDVVPMQSSIWRKQDGSGTWELNVAGIFDMPKNADDRNVLMHYSYFSESLGRGQGLVGWYVVQVRDAQQAPRVAREIDALFANSPYETETSSEKMLAQSFANQVGNIGAILVGVVGAVFFTMLLVTANTMGQSVRERTGELAVLKTLGFTNAGITALVLAEAVVMTTLGGLAGLGLAWFAIESVGPSVRQFLPVFFMPGSTVAWAIVLMLVFGLAAGLLPAVEATRLQIVEALRRG